MHGQIATDLANQFIDTVLSNVRIRVGNLVSITDSARADLVATITSADDLANGGRGITTALENRLVNPLGRILFGFGTDTSVTITAVGVDNDDQPALEIDGR
jgi:hypothetical protein